jgi:CRISPR-associated protein Csx17
MHTILLPGCSPTPLASYLKALGLFRLLSTQCPESNPKAHWQRNTFVLTSSHDRAKLVDFFLHRYAPTPIISPWNGDGGFFADSRKAGRESLGAIEKSRAPRFELYRKAISAARSAVDQGGFSICPEKGDDKDRLLLLCRNNLPDEALGWFDAVVVLSGQGAKFPPLLGTGGNDGSMDFSNNHMQRLADLFFLEVGSPNQSTQRFLENALFCEPTPGLSDKSVGQFNPAAGGGPNASTGFDAQSAINPWDFVLALEGALLFAAAAVKRLEGVGPGQLIYPFCVQPSGSGYGSATQGDESETRCEIWMPLWFQPSGIDEVQTLMSEGRAWVGRRPAKTGVDFALAICSLGVDRGIEEFQRYSFLKRNGKSFYATPLQRLRVHRDTVSSDLLAACDGWLQRFLPKAKGETAPGSVRRAAARLEAAIFTRAASAQDNNPDTAQELLIALGECERALSLASEKWRADSFLKPLPPLPRAWIKASDNHTPEYRLAAALASLTARFRKDYFPLRRHLEPVKVNTGEKAWTDWSDEALNEVVWHEGSVIDVLCAVMKRRLLLAKSAGEISWPEYARLTAWPTDIAAFIEGRIDETRFAQLLWGLSLVDFSGDAMTGDEMPTPPDRLYDEIPPAFYAQLKLCFASRLPDDKRVPIEPIIFNLAASGDGARASTQALRRLHGSSIPVTSIQIPLAGEAARRSAAALLFPLWNSQLATIGRSVAPDYFPQLNLR